jgi:DNA-binding CsgD family transcriptional regulator
MSADPVPGLLLPGHEVLEHVARLIPCDALGMALVDPRGGVLEAIVLPRGHEGLRSGSGWQCAVELGIVPWPPAPGAGRELPGHGIADSLKTRFSHGRGRFALLWLDRRSREFSARDVALLSLVAPAVQRLVGDPASAALPADLTLRERYTISLVAAGLSNPEIADRMGVATSTVRKHLEHAYRKLGVGNRLAAATAVTGTSSTPFRQPAGTGGAEKDSRERE